MNFKLLTIPEGKVKRITSGGTVLWKSGPSYTNLAEPLPDNTTDTTKWVNGYRFSSSGITTEYTHAPSTLSNNIACKNGDIIRISGVKLRANTDRVQLTIIRSDTGNVESYRGYYNSIGETGFVMFIGEENGIYTFMISESYHHEITHFRFAMETPTDTSGIIVTVNEEIM